MRGLHTQLLHVLDQRPRVEGHFIARVNGGPGDCEPHRGPLLQLQETVQQT